MPAVIPHAASPRPAHWPASVWRADGWAAPVQGACSSGFAALDAELPGGGWPTHALTEILLSHDGAVEWRLLGPLLGRLTAQGHDLVLVGPPSPPHPAGLQAVGVSASRLVWLQADTPTERLWCVEQLLKARRGAVVLAWLPQARAPQLRRLQVLAAAGGGVPVFICRREVAAHSASPAPLRVRVRVVSPWAMAVDILKRKGPPLAHPLHLEVVPVGLSTVLPPRLLSLPRPGPEIDHVVVRPVSEPAWH